jgi:hypothetical protein
LETLNDPTEDVIDPRTLPHQLRQQETWRKKHERRAIDRGRIYSGLGRKQLAGLEVLNTEKSWMKFNENMIVTSELVYKDEVFLDLRYM